VFFQEELLDGTNIELKDSVGLAVEAGLDYDLGNDIYLNAAVWYIDIETEVEAGGDTIIDSIDIDPVVGMIGIAKKF
jgi:outer membrane protein